MDTKLDGKRALEFWKLEWEVWPSILGPSYLGLTDLGPQTAVHSYNMWQLCALSGPRNMEAVWYVKVSTKCGSGFHQIQSTETVAELVSRATGMDI